MTKDQHSQVRRENGAKSSGPKTEAGKRRSRGNRLTHGLRARVLTLPEEDAAEVRARHDAWNQEYDPQTPAEQHLLNELVEATLRFDRCTRYHHAQISRQVRDARSDWDADQTEMLEQNKALLLIKPDVAVRQLKRSALGCQWLVSRWEELKETFLSRNAWPAADRDLAIRLWGHTPDIKNIMTSEDVYIICLYNAVAPGERCDRALVEQLMGPELMPEKLRHLLAQPPPAALARAQMLKDVDRELEALSVLAEVLQPRDEADRDEAGDRALLLEDEGSARLYLRYQSEARTAFHRAYAALEKAVRARAEGPEPEVSPNEPETVECPPQGACPETVCDDSPATVPSSATPEATPAPVPPQPPIVRPVYERLVAETDEGPGQSIRTVATMIPSSWPT